MPKRPKTPPRPARSDPSVPPRAWVRLVAERRAKALAAALLLTQAHPAKEHT